MTINKHDKGSQNAEHKSGQSAPEKNKEFPGKKPDANDPKKNDPTINDKPPLIISKL
jgi:hypothetical protein